MDEGLCLYYTIEMLLMLENLHKVGLIHGDFKPDNLLIRSTRSESTTSDLFYSTTIPPNVKVIICTFEIPCILHNISNSEESLNYIVIDGD